MCRLHTAVLWCRCRRWFGLGMRIVLPLLHPIIFVPFAINPSIFDRNGIQDVLVFRSLANLGQCSERLAPTTIMDDLLWLGSSVVAFTAIFMAILVSTLDHVCINSHGGSLVKTTT